MTEVSKAMRQVADDVRHMLANRTRSNVDEMDRGTLFQTGSNAIAISGKHTRSGRPVTSHDPHKGLAYVNDAESQYVVHIENDCIYGPADAVLSVTVEGAVIGLHNKDVDAMFTYSPVDMTDWLILFKLVYQNMQNSQEI